MVKSSTMSFIGIGEMGMLVGQLSNCQGENGEQNKVSARFTGGSGANAVETAVMMHVPLSWDSSLLLFLT